MIALTRKETINNPLSYIPVFLDRLVDLGKSENTILAYSADLAQLQKFTNTGILNYKDADRYSAWLSRFDIAASSIKRKVSSCRSFYTFLLREGIVEINPFLGMETPKIPQRLPKLPSPIAINAIKLEKEIDYRDKALILFLFGSGARISEALSIRMEDVDLQSREVRVIGKGNKERILCLSQMTAMALEGYFKQRNDYGGYVFLSEHSTPLTRRGAGFIIERRFAAIREKVSPHQLRHSFATAILENGANIKDISELLGHSGVNVTSRYLQVSIRRLHNIIEKTFDGT